MKEYKLKINGNDYAVTVKDVDDAVAEVEVNGTPFKVEFDLNLGKSYLKIDKGFCTGLAYENYANSAYSDISDLKENLEQILDVEEGINDILKYKNYIFILVLIISFSVSSCSPHSISVGLPPSLSPYPGIPGLGSASGW